MGGSTHDTTPPHQHTVAPPLKENVFTVSRRKVRPLWERRDPPFGTLKVGWYPRIVAGESYPCYFHPSGWLRASALTCPQISLVGVKWSCFRINQRSSPPAGAEAPRRRRNTGHRAQPRTSRCQQESLPPSKSLESLPPPHASPPRVREVFFFFITLKPRVE